MGNDNEIPQKAILFQMDIYDKLYPFHRNFQCPDNLVGIYQMALQNQQTDIYQYRFKCRAFSKINHQNIIPMQFKIITNKQICSESVSYQLHYNYIRDNYQFPLQEKDVDRITKDLIIVLNYLRTLNLEIVLNKNNLGKKQNRLKYLVRFGETKFGNEYQNIENKVIQFLNKQQLQRIQSIKKQSKISLIKDGSMNKEFNNCQSTKIINIYTDNQQIKKKENQKKNAFKLPPKLQPQQQFNNQSKPSIFQSQQNCNQVHCRQDQFNQQNDNQNNKRKPKPQYENQQIPNPNNFQSQQQNKKHYKNKFLSQQQNINQQNYYQTPLQKLQRKIQQIVINKLPNYNQQIKNQAKIIKCENNLVKIQVPTQSIAGNHNYITQNIDTKQFAFKNMNNKVKQRGEFISNLFGLKQFPNSSLQIKNLNMQIIDKNNSSRRNWLNNNVSRVIQPRICSVDAKLSSLTSSKYRTSVSKHLYEYVYQQNSKANQFYMNQQKNLGFQITDNNLARKVISQPLFFLVNKNKFGQYDSVYGKKQREQVILGVANSPMMYQTKHTILNNKNQRYVQNRKQENQPHLTLNRKYSENKSQQYQRLMNQEKTSSPHFNKQYSYKNYNVLKSKKIESKIQPNKFDTKNQNKSKQIKFMKINQQGQQRTNYHRREYQPIKERIISSISIPKIHIKIQENQPSLFNYHYSSREPTILPITHHSKQQNFQVINQLKKNNHDLQLKVEYLTNELLKLKNQNKKQDQKNKQKQNQVNVYEKKSFGNSDVQSIYKQEVEKKQDNQQIKQQNVIQILQTQFMNRYKNPKNKQLLERLIKAINASKKFIKNKQNHSQ